MAAWVDFGYCRSEATLRKVPQRLWRHPFAPKKLHLFTLEPHTYCFGLLPNPHFPRTQAQIEQAMFGNKPYVIGGVLVGGHQAWHQFHNLHQHTFNSLLDRHIVDDDQGVYLLCHAQAPELIQLNHLPKIKLRHPNWFGVFHHYP